MSNNVKTTTQEGFPEESLPALERNTSESPVTVDATDEELQQDNVVTKAESQAIKIESSDKSSSSRDVDLEKPNKSDDKEDDNEEEEDQPTWQKTIAAGFFLVFNFYCFLVGLGLMGDSFKVLTGKSAGNLFHAVDHPIAGLMVGIIATVLVQSSSTSTSIVVGLVGSNVMPVRQAVYVIMGANIGTSVTNTLVSLGHMQNREEYKRAFAGATVHDCFNLLCVAVLLPAEAIVGAITGTGGILFHLTNVLTKALQGMAGGTFKSPISLIVKPVYKLLLSVDKNKIKALALGIPTNSSCLSKGSKALIVAKVNYKVCGNETVLAESLKIWDKSIVNGVLTKGGAFKGMSDASSGALSLSISLAILCISLYFLVKTLKWLFLGRAKSCIAKAVKMNDVVAIFAGAGITVAVQSSSITTSALTPLVGIGTLPLEKMFPLTLGANIGTTCTALIASFVLSSYGAIQIALCHFLFNVFGILIWYPVPAMRRVPLKAARMMGEMTLKFACFPVFYILTVFLIIPAAILGLSAMIKLGGVFAVFGVILILLIVIGIAFCAFSPVVKNYLGFGTEKKVLNLEGIDLALQEMEQSRSAETIV